GTIVFKGPITSVNERNSDTGVQWVCEASSDVIRLNDSHVTFTANTHQDPNHPVPIFDPESGFLLQAKLSTVVELVELILAFPDAYRTTPHFAKSHIDWNGLRDSPRCGTFTPPNVTLDTAKG